MTIENTFLAVILIASAIFDYKYRKVPNILILPAAAGGFVMAAKSGGFIGFSGSMIGMIVGIALLLFPYAKGGIGAGDVKFLGAIGAIKGAGFVFTSFLGAALIGGIMAVGRMAFILKGSDMRLFGQSIRAASYTGILSAIEIPDYALKEKLPYAVAISAGAIVALILEMR